MILTKNEILKEIKCGKIKITPFDKKTVGPASIDLSLGSFIRVFKENDKKVLVSENLDYKKLTYLVGIKKGYILKPKELVLGITKEKITLPENICGWLSSRSRFARMGLTSHITAPFIAPGVSNKQVLEIYNAGPNNLVISSGVKICQLVLQKCIGSAKYNGKFKNQELR